MDKIFYRWDPTIEYQIGSVVYFDSKLYLAVRTNYNVLPLHRSVSYNIFNNVSNDDLIDDLLIEYNCIEDTPLLSIITYTDEDIPETTDLTMEEMEIEPITWEDYTMYNWKLI